MSSEDKPLGAALVSCSGLIETVALGGDGDTARLYETPAPTGTPSSQATTETLDVVAHGRRVLATGAPGSIAPRSVRIAGGDVTWTQDDIAPHARI